MNRYRKPMIGGLVGASTAGGWLIMDLLLPEPIGDYLLFGLMGAVNAAVGWQVVRMLDKKDAKDIEAKKLAETN
ncbi:hypothetical protein [Ornithinibacillus californiensis]|uniref:hypothetical protein n=1 Tax=Ornithinibacillus californiensis TaxID=161536 RepID=UPI00064DB6E7|nr:hypothetical protein [Ornithinibacillus californiensis]